MDVSRHLPSNYAIIQGEVIMEGARHVKTSQSNVWFKGAFILMLAALITKVLSAVYRIPFQNIVGDKGFYIYQQVYPFYGVIIALSTYGFPVVLSKLYMEMKVEGNQSGINRLVSSSFYLFFPIGIAAFLILFFNAGRLATWMGDPYLASLLKVISFAFLFSPLTAILRGIFQGEGNMIPTAVSQVSEQLLRVGIILFVAVFFSYKRYSLYAIGSGAMFGSVIGGLLSLLVLIYFYRKKSFSLFRVSALFHKENRLLSKRVIFEGITISISSMLLILLQLADSLNLYALLIENGVADETAKVMKGIYDRGQPLIQIGSIISTSMALSIVPLITKNRQKESKKDLMENIHFSLLVSYFIGLGATVGLIGIINETNRMLFENDAGSHVLAILFFIIFFNAIIVTVMSILQGLGHSFYPAILIIFGFIGKYVLNICLVSSYGIAGAAYASLIILFIILLLMVVKLRRIVKEPIIDLKQIAIIIGASFVMLLVLKGYIPLSSLLLEFIENNRIKSAIQALSGVMIGGIVYVFLVLRGNVFKEKELLLLPLGSKLIWFLPKRRKGTK
ncbi:polysaccharide biosynthesis protein [Niallia sp. MER TA 168]|uniref:putative polysaccharide biosynthesis protein n=1 Tax=Niallia sp. MER TA 168 TaxID=2939568 RepID=UPI000B2A0DF1|nr:polysaccharide biosynthesis protein [Niallia sp. MER TA 168]CAI9389707.1 lipid II flippase MurJ [Bacillus sp. T2.9-1]